jgi:hypothetical protein
METEENVGVNVDVIISNNIQLFLPSTLEKLSTWKLTIIFCLLIFQIELLFMSELNLALKIQLFS